MIEKKEKMINLLKVLFPGAKIILFGSRARGDAKETSDIDIAIDAGRELSRYDIFEAINIIDALNIAQKTEIVDYHAVQEALQRQIDKDGVLWSD